MHQWLTSPLGQKIALSEAMTNIESVATDIPRVMESAKTLKNGAVRHKLLKTIDQASMASELQLDVNIFQSSAVSFAANAPHSSAGAHDYSVFYDASNARRPQIAKLINNYTIATLAMSYRDLSNSELKAIISFWGSPTGTRFADALHVGMNNAFRDANRSFNSKMNHIIEFNNQFASSDIQ